MSTKQRRPGNDVSSAPESGTVRDETSGNQLAHPHERGVAPDPSHEKGSGQPKDDPSHAGEER